MGQRSASWASISTESTSSLSPSGVSAAAPIRASTSANEASYSASLLMGFSGRWSDMGCVDLVVLGLRADEPDESDPARKLRHPTRG